MSSYHLCRKCGVEFTPTPNQIKKSDYLCVECSRSYQASWRSKRRRLGLTASGSKTWDPAKKKTWVENYYSSPKIRSRKAAQMKRYRNDPLLRDRHKARWLTSKAVASGRLIRSRCESCGNESAQAHHDDYSRPLDVRWLCRPCHIGVHAKAEGREL